MKVAPTSVAVIGCGMLAQSQHLPNVVRSVHMRLHACCDVSEEVLDNCRVRFSPEILTTDYHQIVNDPRVELVIVATTEKTRLPIIRACAKARKPIYVEKPVANSLEELAEIERLVTTEGIPFCAGHNRRCAPAAVAARSIFRQHRKSPQPVLWRLDREPSKKPQLLDKSAAGILIRINDDWHSWKSWALDKTHAPHGPMLFEMTHFTDLCNWFMATTPVEVVALEGGTLNHGVVIRYECGGIATIMMSAGGTLGYPKELYEMMGQGAIVVVDHLLEVRTAGIPWAPPHQVFRMVNDRHPKVGQEGGISGWLAKKRAACDEAAVKGDPWLQFAAEPDKGHAAMLEGFVEQIHSGSPEVCGIRDVVLATRVAFAAVRSATTRRAVSMDELS